MGHSSVRLKVRRRKVAQLRAYSKQFSVINHQKKIPKKMNHPLHYDDLENAITCPFTGHKFVPTNPHPIHGKFGITITGYDWVEPEGKLWVIPKEGYPQPEHLHHSHKGGKWIKFKDGSSKFVTWKHKSQHKDDTEYQKMLWKNLGKAAKMKAYEDEKVKKWERKHPQPCPDDDLFKVEYQTKWYADRDAAIERIRDVVVSMFDKLPLTGRYKESDSKFVEKPVTELKDKDGEGHKLNELDPDKSKLLDKAQKATNKEKAKNAKLVATNLKDHKRKKGRIILPEAA